MPTSPYVDRALIGRPRTRGALGSFKRPDCCPHCGQTMPDNVRYGVRLSPILLRMFDAVTRHPGITQHELFDAVYPKKGYDPKRNKSTISTHIARINSLFAHTDVCIKGRQYSGYRLTGI